MSYYLLTTAQYDQQIQQADTDQYVAWTFDGTKCLVELDNSYVLSEYLMFFENSSAVNEWRYDDSTDEWRNWMSQEDYYGE